MAYETPIHEGGSKQNPEQYRQVSLTTHIIKGFERVIKKKIMDHMVDNHALLLASVEAMNLFLNKTACSLPLKTYYFA